MGAFRASDSPDLLFLYGLQKLGLHGNIHGIDLIEKQSSAVCQFKQPFSVFRSCEAAFFHAEEDTFQKRFRDRRAVLGDKRLFGPVGAGVQRLGEQLLSRSRLPVEKHGRIIVGDQGAPLLQGDHNGVLGNNVVQSIQLSLTPLGKPLPGPVFVIKDGGGHSPHDLASG